MSTSQAQMARLIAQQAQAQQTPQQTSSSAALDAIILKEKNGEAYDPNRRALEDGNWYESDSAMGARMVLDGMLLGWSDELIAHGMAAYAKLEGSQDDYETIRKQMKRELDEDEQAWREENPVLATSLNVAGAVLSPANLVAPGAAAAARASGMARAGYTVARGATEGAISGAGMAGEEDRVGGALTGLAFGGGTSAVLQGGGWLWNASSKRRIAQNIVTDTVDETGQTVQKVTPITLAANTADEVEEGVASVYRDVIGTVWGGSGAIARQEDAIINPVSARVARTKEVLDKAVRNADEHMATIKRTGVASEQAHKESVKSSIESVRQSLAGKLDDAQSTIKNTKQEAEVLAVKTLDDEVRQAEEAFRAQAFFKSMPTGIKGDEIDDIVNITVKTPNAAMDKAEALWKEKGFQMLKNRKFQVNKSSLIKELESKVLKDPASEFLDPAQVRTLIKRTAGFLDDKVNKGWIDGNDLAAVRSRYGQLVAKMPDTSEGMVMGAIYREMQDVMNNTVQKQLSGKALKEFGEHREAWKHFTVLRTAVESASNKAGGIGRFTPDDWVAGIGKNSKFDLRTGRGPLRADADTVAISMAKRDKALKDTANNVVRRAEENFKLTRAAIRNEAAKEIRRLRATGAEKSATNAQKLDTQVKRASHRNRIEALQKAHDDATSQLQLLQKNATDRDPSIFKRMVALGVLGAVGGLNTAGAGLLVIPAVGRGLATPTAQKVFAGQTGIQAGMQATSTALQRPSVANATLGQNIQQIMSRTAAQQNTTNEDLEAIRRQGLLR